MPIYEYAGKTQEGTDASGAVEAPNRAAATARLRAQGLWIETLAEAGKGPGGAGNEARGRAVHWSLLYGLRPVSPGRMGHFFEQLAGLYRAGVGMQTVATETAERLGDGRLRRVLLTSAPRLAAGGTLSDCLADWPQIFPPSAVGNVRLGELTGNLDLLSKDLADDYQALQRAWWVALIPKVYVLLVLLLVALVPSFPRIISEGFVWWVSHVEHQILPLLGLVLVAYWVLCIIWHLPATFALRDSLAYSLPVWSQVTRSSGMTRFYRGMELAARAGVEFPEALSAAALATGNRVMADRLQGTATAVRNGQPLPDALRGSGLLSVDASNLVGTAGLTGTYDQTFASLVTDTRARRVLLSRALVFAGGALGYVIMALIVLAACYVGYMTLYDAIFKRAEEFMP
jgi:type II secretory pathway component PulF